MMMLKYKLVGTTGREDLDSDRVGIIYVNYEALIICSRDIRAMDRRMRAARIALK